MFQNYQKWQFLVKKHILRTTQYILNKVRLLPHYYSYTKVKNSKDVSVTLKLSEKDETEELSSWHTTLWKRSFLVAFWLRRRTTSKQRCHNAVFRTSLLRPNIVRKGVLPPPPFKLSPPFFKIVPSPQITSTFFKKNVAFQATKP